MCDLSSKMVEVKLDNKVGW